MNQDKMWDYFQTEGRENFSGSHGRLEFLARKLASNTKVLNIGIGNGYLETIAHAKGVDIHSLDPSEKAVSQIRQKLNLGEKVQTGYSQKIPFPGNFFDTVIMSEVLEHLNDETLDSTLSEVYRILQGDGMFIGTVPARENLFASLTVCPDCGEKFHRYGHQQSFDVQRLSNILQQHGFAIHEVKETFFIDWENTGLIRKMAGLIKKFLSWHNISVWGTNRNIYFSVRKISR
ncbi:MAG: class I SAM-dependent methyltransferase [Azoarcus sp.]|jgi:SAM-dependent methyltransferase|nr:class I SAM-dependent methyltransferase [Azoarcus sp.]